MHKVALTLEDDSIPVDDLEELLESLRPILTLATNATIHVVILEE